MKPIILTILSLPLVAALHVGATPNKPQEKFTSVEVRKVVYKPAVRVAVAIKPIDPPHPIKTTPAAPAKPTAPVYQPPPTTHEGLMAAAGIPVSDYAAVDYIVSHESGWDADATEPTTGAHGLPQALPYSKTGCGWDDAVCQLEWANSYAVARYGGWWAAYNYWVIHRNW